MAAGKVGGYPPNEFRGRESNILDSRNECNRFERRDHEIGHVMEFRWRKEHGRRDGYKVRQKDNRKREELDDWFYSSVTVEKSGSGGSYGKGRNQFNNKATDRESGELSGEGGSDGSISSVLENNTELPPRKKPKFSAIVWDSEEKKVSSKLINGVVPTISSFSLVANHSNLLIGPTRSCEHLSDMVLPGLLDSTSITPSPQEWHGSCDREAGQVEEEDYVPERNISGSRWADEDEAEISVNEELKNSGKRLPASGSSGTSLSSIVLSPELGEFISRNGGESECQAKLYKNDDLELSDDDEDDKTNFHGSDMELKVGNKYLWTPEPTYSKQRTIDMFHSSRSVHEFERLNTIGAGTYGVVYHCRDKRNGEIVALKKVKMDKEREGFPLTSLREINILVSLRHPSIVDVKEVVVEEDVSKGKFETYLVMEYMEHDLRGFMEVMKQPFSQSEVKCLMLQLLEGVSYLHDNWVLHRDLKTSNLLLNNRGELKICDFGLSRQYGSPLKPYTPLVVTLGYRAPELLLGAKQYSTAIDMWSVGCIMSELLSKKPLFRGETEIDQLNKIFETLGTPSEKVWPGFSKLPGSKVNFAKQKHNLLWKKFPPASFTGSDPIITAAGFNLLNRLLTYDPQQRITAQDAINHEWFREFPLPKAKEFMPTFPAQHDKPRY